MSIRFGPSSPTITSLPSPPLASSIDRRRSLSPLAPLARRPACRQVDADGICPVRVADEVSPRPAVEAIAAGGAIRCSAVSIAVYEHIVAPASGDVVPAPAAIQQLAARTATQHVV